MVINSTNINKTGMWPLILTELICCIVLFVFNDLRLEAQFVVFFCVEMLTIIVNFLVFNDLRLEARFVVFFLWKCWPSLLIFFLKVLLAVQEQKWYILPPVANITMLIYIFYTYVIKIILQMLLVDISISNVIC